MINPKKSFSQYLNIRKLHPVAVDINDPVKIFFVHQDAAYDITNYHALVSLKPFAIAVNAAAINFLNPARATLRIVDNEKVLGMLHLKACATEKFNDITLNVYEAALPGFSISFSTAVWNAFLLQVKNKTDKRSQNFVVPPWELLKLFVYSLKPRPVFLVSVLHEKGFDVFPIDIAGTISETQCMFSIRSTSAAIAHILTTKKICAAAIPYEQRTAAYQLGRHHAGAIVPDELKALNFITSEQWRIPIPAFATDVQELILEHSFQKGVHTQFVFRVINSYSLITALQLAHTPWFNRKYFKNSFDLRK
ncbi:MAG: hypothetical protein ABIO46_01700 [Chitinophagales bacterium]